MTAEGIDARRGAAEAAPRQRAARSISPVADTGQRPTILLVEDETAITEPLAEALDREGFDAVVAGTVSEALQLAGPRAPDLVLLDIGLPDGSGLDVCRELRRTSDVPVIMLTARGSEADRVAGLELGADDYVVKPFSAREVTARVRAVLRRRPVPGRRRAEARAIGDVRLDRARHEATLDGEPIELARKEYELLRVLMESAGSVISRQALIEEVWDMNWFGSTKTLDVHMSGLRRKLGDDAQEPRYIHTVRGVGFRFSGRGRGVSLRARLLAAFAYTLLIVIVALEVPLATNLNDRVEAEVEADSAAQAQVVAVSAGERLAQPARLSAVVTEASDQLGGPVAVVDGRGGLLAISEPGATAGAAYATAERPELLAALNGRIEQSTRGSSLVHRGADRPQRADARRPAARAGHRAGRLRGAGGRRRAGRHRPPGPGAGPRRRLDPRRLHREAASRAGGGRPAHGRRRPRRAR